MWGIQVEDLVCFVVVYGLQDDFFGLKRFGYCIIFSEVMSQVIVYIIEFCGYCCVVKVFLNK